MQLTKPTVHGQLWISLRVCDELGWKGCSSGLTVSGRPDNRPKGSKCQYSAYTYTYIYIYMYSIYIYICVCIYIYGAQLSTMSL